MANPYTGAAITGCNSPAVGADKDTYTTTFDQTIQKLDEHDHTSGKGNQIPTAGIADLAVTGAKIAAATIPNSKLVAVNKTFSAEIGFETSGAGNTDEPGTAETVTNASAAITTVGRPVAISLQGYAASVVEHGLYIYTPTNPFDHSNQYYVFLFRDGTLIERWLISGCGNPVFPVQLINFEDHEASAASHTYTLKAGVSNAGDTISFYGCRLLVREL